MVSADAAAAAADDSGRPGRDRVRAGAMESQPAGFTNYGDCVLDLSDRHGPLYGFPLLVSGNNQLVAVIAFSERVARLDRLLLRGFRNRRLLHPAYRRGVYWPATRFDAANNVSAAIFTYECQ